MKRLTFENGYAATTTKSGKKASIMQNNTNIGRPKYSVNIEFEEGWKTMCGRCGLDRAFEILEAN